MQQKPMFCNTLQAWIQTGNNDITQSVVYTHDIVILRD